MPDRDQLRGTVLQFEGEQFRVSDFRDREAMDTTEVTLEPENPNNERLPLRMSLSEIEKRTASGEMTGGVPDPRRIHQNRPSFERKQDNARDAQITTDPEQWAQAPDRFDFPGVDTGPEFRQENPDFDTDSFMERIFDL